MLSNYAAGIMVLLAGIGALCGGIREFIEFKDNFMPPQEYDNEWSNLIMGILGIIVGPAGIVMGILLLTK